MSPETHDNIFFFIVNQRKYFEQAYFSAQRINEVMPDNPVFIFIASPLDWNRDELPTNGFTGRIKINVESPYNDPSLWYLQSIYLMRQAVECLHTFGVRKAIYMDCDTYLIDPVPELFEMLDHFEFMGAHAPGRQTAPTPIQIPDAFPEINIGVNPMRINENAVKFWGRVLKLMLNNLGVFGNNDQAPLRYDLYIKGSGEFPIFYVLPPEYNIRFHFPFMVKGRVKILHGSQEYAERVADLVNQNQGDMRAWTSIIKNL